MRLWFIENVDEETLSNMTADKNLQQCTVINLRRHHDLYERGGEFYSRGETDHQTLTLSCCEKKEEVAAEEQQEEEKEVKEAKEEEDEKEEREEEEEEAKEEEEEEKEYKVVRAEAATEAGDEEEENQWTNDVWRRRSWKVHRLGLHRGGRL